MVCLCESAYDTVVWFFPFLVGNEGLEDLIGQEADEKLTWAFKRSERFCHFYIGEMPDRDPDSKERLVLAVGGKYDVSYLERSFPADKITRAMADHGKRFPYNHRLAVFLHHRGPTISSANPLPWYLENVADPSTVVIVRMGFERWLPQRRAWFNTQFGDAVRAGADCIEAGEPGQIGLIQAMDVIKYALNRNKFRVEEEMISGKPVASTKASEVFKEQLAKLIPRPLESWRK
ncbi:hypothetical protein FA15DRAFT_701054 [Coprinopsis marcescibilis]|uniref:Uncharacterized protein n=1 Tax=Coprinopsis marcescibilis TaxID=230819 RepID=A0A5C3L6L7_COPMA|nr:hypothetical protein FA15DRAFT_701054 [Coprinopsis marcescibilis]